MVSDFEDEIIKKIALYNKKSDARAALLAILMLDSSVPFAFVILMPELFIPSKSASAILVLRLSTLSLFISAVPILRLSTLATFTSALPLFRSSALSASA